MIELEHVYKEISGDIETPVTAYLKLNASNSFLLESVTGGEQVARFSIIGMDPFCIFKYQHQHLQMTMFGKDVPCSGNPFDVLEKQLSSFSLDINDDLPSFVGGAVGYFGWDTIFHIESIQRVQKEVSKYPDAHFLFPKSMVIFDHAKRKIILLTLVPKGDIESGRKALRDIENRLNEPLTSQSTDIGQVPDDVFETVTSTYEKASFKSDVEKVKKHIYEGDVFQLVLSQRFSIESAKKPFDVYRSLRAINPSPYMYYFRFEDYYIIGSSPEILTCLENGKAKVRPLAGSRPRQKENEHEVVEELKSDDKEKAEHIMLVDLGRNDLGRVCDYQSIQTSHLMEVEKYSHIMHMVSHVSGTLSPDKSAMDLLKATFPAGTVSGAPKVRAIELIEEIEPTRRGPYSGALGYFDYKGNMDMCIMIRTLFMQNGVYDIQAGAGIVADSDPELEYTETRNKAKGIISACF
ncbi:MAG: anthranilate synthase component I [Candidatus Margulisbacteria bacterium]|nr:anthranilate synthase component I [Candidatus Margulisiibacteriota bacterium]